MREADSRMRWISTTVCGRTEQSGEFGIVFVGSVNVFGLSNGVDVGT